MKGSREKMKNPLSISIGLFLFLFGLAFAKGLNKNGNDKQPSRNVASAQQLKAQ